MTYWTIVLHNNVLARAISILFSVEKRETFPQKSQKIGGGESIDFLQYQMLKKIKYPYFSYKICLLHRGMAIFFTINGIFSQFKVVLYQL